ncbi:MAG: hypothetical protein GX142_01170 [Chloroflexi bacterium]|jgi:hypothetical protein|nr:hypothetical protein [Chloroflexota bacterium]
MNTNSDSKIQSPSIIQALIAGFNTIANKPGLILIPIILDLFLWFGPAWRVDHLFSPLAQGFTQLPGANVGEFLPVFEDYQAVMQEILANFNLAVSLRTLPVGVPSLMVSKPSFLNPIGQPLTFSLESSFQFLITWLLFIFIGYFLGSLYFQSISKQIVSYDQDNFKSLLKSFLQIVLMPILLLIVTVILSVPLIFLVAFVVALSPLIGQLLLTLSMIFILWAIIPLIFTPHGIFLYQQNLIAAMITSINVVRISMSKTIWFFFASYLMVEGLNYLWRSPNVDNWFLFVGIFGHAFIVSAIIAASFHYFIDATKFSQTVINQKLKSV